MYSSSIFIACLCCSHCLFQQPSDGQQNAVKLVSGYRIVKREAFLVNPDDLRRIAIVLERARDRCPTRCAVVYGVIRADRRYYETTNIEDLFADPNVIGKEIVWVSAVLRVTDSIKLADPREVSDIAAVDFDATPSPGITIKASANDRSWALSLADELEPQVQRTINRKSTPIWLLAIMVCLIVVLLTRLRRRLQKGSIPRFLVDMVAHPAVLGMIIGGLIASYGVWSQTEWFRMAFGPIYGFAWGDYERVIADWSAVRTNVLWVVVVGGSVAILANFFSALWKSPESTSGGPQTTTAEKNGEE